jgi:RNA polymerase sigma-70 factor, ECF subfamily
LPDDAISAEERALAERFLLHGDEFAFRALYRCHTPRLYRLAYRLVPHGQSAADVVQDTWIRAAERLASFRWESSLATWLAGIVINRCREETRRHKSEAPTSPEQPEPTVAAASLPERVDLERAISNLAEGYREVLLLHDVEGYTHEEIAQALQIEPATSRSQLARARAAMREWLEYRKER